MVELINKIIDQEILIFRINSITKIISTMHIMSKIVFRIVSKNKKILKTSIKKIKL